MKSKYISLMAGAAMFLAFPFSAFAHEHRTYQIGAKQYSVVVGSLNEPIHVDDKSGVEVIVSDLSIPAQPSASGDDDDGPTGAPVSGLEKTLRVEVSAGDQTKTFDLEPEYGKSGSYQAVFYPTVQTTYSYRLTGTINNVPVDLTYTCDPAATEDSPEDTTAMKVSDQVMQVSKGGAFSCPAAKTDVEFPTPSASTADLTARISALENQKKSPDLGTAGFAIAIVGLILGGKALQMAKKR